MSESSIVPYVKTTPKPFGLNVEWKWPGGCAELELQCLHEDGRLVKERIYWPATEYLISGLKAGERLQVRLRPIAADGSVRDWRASDWVEGVSSVDAGEMIQALQDDILSSATFDALDGIADLPRYKISSDIAIEQKIADALDTVMDRYHEQFGNAEPEKTAVVFLADRWVAIEGNYTADEMSDAVEYIKRKRKEKADAKAMAESSPFTVKDGQVFIKDAHIGNSVGSGWRITNVGVTINSHNFIPKKGINDNFQQGESRVKILAEKLAVAANTQNALETALQQSIKKVVDEAIQQTMRPGGVLWKGRSRGI